MAFGSSAEEQILRQSRAWQDGMTRALGHYVDAATEAATSAKQVTTLAFKTMEDALVGFATTDRADKADSLRRTPPRAVAQAASK